MSPGAKVFLALAGVGVVFGGLALASSKKASALPAQPPQPKPGSNAPPDVVVPPPSSAPPAQQPPPFIPPTAPPSNPVPPFVPTPGPALPPPTATQPLPPATGPLNQPTGPSLPVVPAGVTFSIPNPADPTGAPLGTFDPATGNVFGPNGIVIGTFNPITGLFKGPGGFQVQIPGFGPATPPTPQNVPAPANPPAATNPPLPSAPGPSLPIPPAAPPAPAPSTPTPTVQAPVVTVERDTAAMVSALLDAETRAGWNATDPNVTAWQRARPPLVVDGKFGPTTALKVAQTFGTIPLVRFWPANGQSKATLLSNYQSALIDLANATTDPVRSQQLRFSAQREQAQAFSTKGKLPAVPEANQIKIAQVA